MFQDTAVVIVNFINKGVSCLGAFVFRLNQMSNLAFFFLKKIKNIENIKFSE